MSIDIPNGAYLPPTTGEYEADPLTPLTVDFEKLKSGLGFVDLPEADALLAGRLDLDDHSFNEMMAGYTHTYQHQNALPQHDLSDVYPYRGILVNVAQIYYERQYFRPTRGASDRARNYQYKEYLRTVDEDMRFLNEPSNEHLDKLLIETGVKLPQFPDLRLVRFNTNIMRVLSKIDPNIAALYKNTPSILS